MHYVFSHVFSIGCGRMRYYIRINYDTHTIVIYYLPSILLTLGLFFCVSNTVLFSPDNYGQFKVKVSARAVRLIIIVIIEQKTLCLD